MAPGGRTTKQTDEAMDALLALDPGSTELEAPPDPSELIAEAEEMLGAFLEIPSHELQTDSVSDVTFASVCRDCAVAPNYPVFAGCDCHIRHILRGVSACY